MRLRYRYEQKFVTNPTITGCGIANKDYEYYDFSPYLKSKHQRVLLNEISEAKEGILILESVPQTRVILVDGNKYSVRCKFPYLLHVVSYYFDGINYIYEGIYQGGLNVFMRSSSLKSCDDHVFLSPTDTIFHGLSCTNHSFDYSEFSNLKSLVNFVISLWWSSKNPAFIEYFDPNSLEETSRDLGSIHDSISYAYRNCHNFYDLKYSLIPPEKFDLIDKAW